MFYMFASEVCAEVVRFWATFHSPPPGLPLAADESPGHGMLCSTSSKALATSYWYKTYLIVIESQVPSHQVLQYYHEQNLSRCCPENSTTEPYSPMILPEVPQMEHYHQAL